MKLNYTPKSCGSLTSSDSPRSSDKKELIAVLHGFGRSSKRIDSVVRAVQSRCKHADTWVPLLPYRWFWRVDEPERVLQKLVEDLDTLWAAGNYESLRIVGHSIGGVYGRALILRAQADTRKDHPWVRNVTRLVLLAALNRGVGISRYMGPARVLAVALGILFGKLIQTVTLGYREPTVASALRGAVFLTKMRLQWLDHCHKHKMPLTVQLLGSVDDIVGPDDNIDLATGSQFRYLDVEYTGHLNILDMDRSDSGAFAWPVLRRRIQLRKALLLDPEDLKPFEVRPWELEEPNAAEVQRREAIEDVIFVIHGIRDEGHWTDKIARRVWMRAKKTKRGHIEKVVDSYGYFGMGPFLLPFIRRRKVAWLLERYLETRSRYPNASFSYIGHSHGTYVLAKALETYDSCRFHNIVFAGSVVRESYPWQKLIHRKQAKRVLNFVATHDWVVALFPRLFDLYNLQDLGGAGHNGFSRPDEDSDKVFNVCYAKGAHGAGKREELWDTIAQFVLRQDDDSEPDRPTDSIETERLSRFLPFLLWLLSWGNILVWTVLGVLVLVVVPIALVAAWPAVASFITSTYALLVEPAVLGTLGIVAVLAYLRLVYAQRKCERRFQSIRNFVAFPLALAISIWIAHRFSAWLFSLDWLANWQFPPIETWASAVLLAWVFLVLWVLRKI